MNGYKFLFTAIIVAILFIQCLHCFKSEKGISLAEKVAHLKDMTAKKNVIKLNSFKFREYIKWTGRNYSMVIMFTALESHRECAICGMVNEEFNIVAKSFYLTYGLSDKLFFGIVDYDDGSEVFKALQLNSAPMIVYIPPKKTVVRISELSQLEMQRVGFSAESIARFIAEKTGMDFKIFRPPNYVSTFGLLTLVFVGSLVMYFKQENFEFLHNRTLWAIITICICLVMTSGQMWNHIRGASFYHRSGNGINYIHGSSQYQFVSETYIIFMLNAIFTACVIMIIENGYHCDVTAGKKVTTSVAVVVAALLFSTVLSIFKAKAGGYPYRGLL